MNRPTPAPNEYRATIEKLKLFLKERGITYKELAKDLNLSESGIKKILSAQDGSFLRLTRICAYVGISLSELLEDNRMWEVEFSARQQAAFLKEPLLFQVFWLLVYERWTLDEVRDQLGLTKTEAFRWVRKLDSLDLITLLPGDRLRIPAVKAIRWTGEGEFINKMYKEWSRNLVADVAKAASEAEELFIIRYFQMTPKTRAEFISSLKSLEAEFVRRAIQEMRVRPPGLEHVRWLTVSDTRSFVTGRKRGENVTKSAR